jgi:hypothetical protein
MSALDGMFFHYLYTKRVLRELLPAGGFHDYMERAVAPRRSA